VSIERSVRGSRDAVGTATLPLFKMTRPSSGKVASLDAQKAKKNSVLPQHARMGEAR